MWVVDALNMYDNFDFREKGNHTTFRWKWPRKSWWFSKRPVLFDFGHSLFQLNRIHRETPCGGWGKWVDYDTFLTKLGGDTTFCQADADRIDELTCSRLSYIGHESDIRSKGFTVLLDPRGYGMTNVHCLIHKSGHEFTDRFNVKIASEWDGVLAFITANTGVRPNLSKLLRCREIDLSNKIY